MSYMKWKRLEGRSLRFDLVLIEAGRIEWIPDAFELLVLYLLKEDTMIAKIESACLIGMEAARVQVEVSLAKGTPTFSMVGLPDASVREAKDRVVAAIRNTGFEFPSRRVTVNLAPADLRKEGACFDLAIAVGILMASEAITPPALAALRLAGGTRAGRFHPAGPRRASSGAQPLPSGRGLARASPSGIWRKFRFYRESIFILSRIFTRLCNGCMPKESRRPLSGTRHGKPARPAVRGYGGYQRAGDGQARAGNCGGRPPQSAFGRFAGNRKIHAGPGPAGDSAFLESSGSAGCHTGPFRGRHVERRRAPAATALPEPASFGVQGRASWAEATSRRRAKFRSRTAESSSWMSCRNSGGMPWKPCASLWSRALSISNARGAAPLILRTLFWWRR